ncbi:MAG: signal peptidase I [Candidatus Aenigmarchaeota archaeon]|nr:signal peptidase I [Candidatus Aenigmarchaeota archaeon]
MGSKILPKFLTDTWYGNVIIGVLGAVIFYYVILSLLFNTNTPIVAVISGSMEHTPTLEITHYQWLENNLDYNRTYIDSWPVHNGLDIGDMPIIKGEKSYNVGDVIVYSVGGINAPIIHRIIKINDDGTYQTKGDNNNAQNYYEKSVGSNQINGKIIFIIPKIGYFKVFINRLIGV